MYQRQHRVTSIIINCFKCQRKLRIPSNVNTLIYKCPHCQQRKKWSKKDRDVIAEFVASLRNYKPKVAIIGKSGSGKSSLINALFSKNLSKVSHVKTGTHDIQEFNYKGITILDFPGLADLKEKNEGKFENLYKNKLNDVDLAIWVVPANDRANSPDVKAYKEYLRPEKNRMPTMFVLSKADLLALSCGGLYPDTNWDYVNFEPKESVEKLLQEKIHVISNEFGIAPTCITAIATTHDECLDKYYSYNLDTLVNKIVRLLPKEKKYSFTREVKNENVTDKARTDAEKGIWDSAKEFMGEAFDSVKNTVKEIIIASSPTLLLKWVKRIFF